MVKNNFNSLSTTWKFNKLLNDPTRPLSETDYIVYFLSDKQLRNAKIGSTGQFKKRMRHYDKTLVIRGYLNCTSRAAASQVERMVHKAMKTNPELFEQRGRTEWYKIKDAKTVRALTIKQIYELGLESLLVE